MSVVAAVCRWLTIVLWSLWMDALSLPSRRSASSLLLYSHFPNLLHGLGQLYVMQEAVFLVVLFLCVFVTCVCAGSAGFEVSRRDERLCRWCTGHGGLYITTLSYCPPPPPLSDCCNQIDQGFRLRSSIIFALLLICISSE